MRSLVLLLLSGQLLLISPLALALAVWLVILGGPAHFFAFLAAGILIVLSVVFRPRPFCIRLSPAHADAILRELDDAAARVRRDLVHPYLYEWGS